MERDKSLVQPTSRWSQPEARGRQRSDMSCYQGKRSMSATIILLYKVHIGLSFIFSHREGSEDIGEEDYAIRLIVPPRLKRNLRGQVRILRPLPKGRVLRQRERKKCKQKRGGNATNRADFSIPLHHTGVTWLTRPRLITIAMAQR